MAVNVSPSVGSMRGTYAQQAQHIAVGFATEAGAIIATSAWILYGAVVMLFGLFGVDLFASVQQAQWVVGTGITEFSAIYAPLFTFAVGIVANVILGGVVGAVYAWWHNAFAGTSEEM